MDGRAFLDSARHLLAAPSEANWRSVVGRGYYAVLNEAREALERWGFPVLAKVDYDDFVLSHFNTMPNLDLLRVADALSRLNEKRKLAEQSLSGPGAFADDKEATRVLVLAETGIDVLDQIEADPMKRAAAIADIRTAFP